MSKSRKKTVPEPPREKLPLINRELSWLAFNRRVLALAQDEEVPLLERLNSLAITASNLDEFCMVRLGALLTLEQDSKVRVDDASGLDVAGQVREVREGISAFTEAQYATFHRLAGDLAAEGIEIVAGDAGCTDADRAFLLDFVAGTARSVATPMAVGGAPAAPMPLFDNLGLYLLVRMGAPGLATHAAIPLNHLPRFIRLPSPSGTNRFVPIESAVAAHIGQFFPAGAEIAETVPFRMTRNADLAVREEESPDLLSGMEDVLEWRLSAPVVRVEIPDSASDDARKALAAWLHCAPEAFCPTPGIFDLSGLRKLPDLRGVEALRFPPWPQQQIPGLGPRDSILARISGEDLLLAHPYDSFDPVVRFISEAADDPDVLAIRQVLYRSGTRSGIIDALIRAAANGKAVTVLVELKARFDEERNIGWARRLELEGIQVIYGVRGYKTHAKVCIVVRREDGGIRRYVHLGTGNYNEASARIYSDLSLLTCDPDIGNDAVAFFNSICGLSSPVPMEKLVMAPIHLRDRLELLLDQAIATAREGLAVKVMLKVNALVDTGMIAKLCEASCAGVEILANVRGVCRLRPGVRRISERIRIVSIVDRYLEHARILAIVTPTSEAVYLSSADWMPRNLDRRIELLFPVESEDLRMRVLSMLGAYFRDNTRAWALQSDGEWKRIRRGKSAPFNAQRTLQRQAETRSARRTRPVMFEPHCPTARD